MLSTDVYPLHHSAALSPGPVIGPAGVLGSVGKGAQSHMGEHAGLLTGNGPQQMCHHTQREHIGGQAVLSHHTSDFGTVGQVGRNKGLHQTVIAQAVEAHIVIGVVSGADAGKDSEGGGMPAGAVALDHSVQKLIGTAIGAETSNSHRGAIGDQAGGFLCCNDFHDTDSFIYAVAECQRGGTAGPSRPFGSVGSKGFEIPVRFYTAAFSCPRLMQVWMLSSSLCSRGVIPFLQINCMITPSTADRAITASRHR